MNQVYKVVFNKATGVFVAVAEYARGQGKKSNRSGVDHPVSQPNMQAQTDSSLSKRFSLAAITAALLAVSGTSIAADYEDYLEINDANTTQDNAVANKTGAVALGVNAQAKFEQSIAIGTSALSNNNKATAVGFEVKATGENSTALGNSTSAGGVNSVSIGSNARTSRNAPDSISIGTDSNSTGEYSIALGTKSESSDRSVAIGFDSYSNGLSSTAIGSSSESVVDGGVAIGQGSLNQRKSIDSSNYNGNEVSTADTDGVNPIYLDNQVYTLGIADDEDKINVVETVLGNVGAVSIGDTEGLNGPKITRQITDLAAGSEDTDAVNVSQLKAVANVASKGFDIEVSPSDPDTPDNPDTPDITTVKPGGTINFKGNDPITITKEYDEDTDKLTIDVSANLADFKSEKGEISLITTPDTPSTNALATANDITDAINKSGWTASAKNKDSNIDSGSDFLVNPGDEVSFSSLSDGLKIKNQDILDPDTDIVIGTEFTFEIDENEITNNLQLPVVYTNNAGDKLYKLDDGSGNISFNTAADGSGDTIQPANIIASMNNGAGETTTPMTLTNIKGNLDGANGNPAPSKSGTAPTTVKDNNAATVGDVLNSGFNLAVQNDKTTVTGTDADPIINTETQTEAVDFVSTYDTLNLKAGKGLKAEANTDGSATTVEYEVKTDGKTIGFDDYGNVTALTGSVVADTNKPGATTTTTPNKLATAGNVSTAINNAGFNIKGQNVDSDGEPILDNVKLGETVAYQGTDGNILTEVMDNEVGFSLADTVTIGDNENGNPITVNGNKGNIGGLTNKTFNPKAFTSGQAATEDQLALIANQSSAWKLTANGKDAVDVGKGDTVDFKNSDTNIEVSKTETGSNIGIGLADNIVVDTVTIGSPTGDVSLSKTGLDNGANKVINVAPGELSASSMDAVNGSQLFGTNQNVTKNANNIAGNTATINKGINFGNGVTANNYKLGDTIGVAGDQNISSTTTDTGVQVSLNDNITVDSVTAGNTSLSTNGINAGGNTITNVAPGVEGTDAANVDQLKALDDKINNIDDHQDEANAGISSAMAMASLPQAYLPGKSMVTGGMASYDGEGAVAVGLSKLTDNGRWVFKISGSADTEGNAGGAVGAGMHF